MRAKTKLTRLCGILLTLVLLVGLLPTVALAAGAATADFKTDPTTALALLNAAKTGTADSTWNPDTNTLTLNGVNFTTTAATAVKLPDGATIVLADGTTNTITGDCYGIYVAGDLTISGTGTLNVTAVNTEDYYSFGIYASSNVTISGGTVTATGGNTDTECDSYGIYAYSNVTISGGTVTATGGNAYYSYGIFADEKVTISGGTVTATGGTADECSDGIAGSVTITGGTVTATGGEAGWNSYGIDGDVTISGGAVTATGGNAGYRSFGIFAGDNVTISGGTVKAEADDESFAAFALNKQPTLPTAYWWRTGESGDYSQSPGTEYNGSAAHLEIWNWDPTKTADFTADADAALALLNAAKTGGAADSTWEVDGSGNPTLTLNGVNFTTTAATAVKLPANTTIVLNGENTIKGGDRIRRTATAFGAQAT